MTNSSNTDNPLKKTTLRSNEFSCPSCVEKIETRLKGMEGVESAEVKFASGRIIISHDPKQVSIPQLVDAVAKVGFTAKPSAI